MGVRQGLVANKTFEWPAVLHLCDSVLSHAADNPGQETRLSERDPGWGWSRNSVADLMNEAFAERAGMLPITLREDAWRLLEALSEDPDPTPASEGQFGPNASPFEVSINTTRSQAIHGVIRYGLWIRRRSETQPDAESALRRGFDEMSEVRRVLDRHLEPERERSLAVRSVYGHWTPWLQLLDPSWAAMAVPKIFSADDRSLWAAAWDGYIRFREPYNDILPLLRPVYSAAVDRLGTADVPQTDEADNHLAEHLMAFYLRGKLDFDAPDCLLERFYQKAPDKIRAHAAWFLGHPPAKGDDVDPAMVLKAQTLWERRIAEVRPNPDAAREELAMFGWWFVSKLFPLEWALSNLCTVLALGGHVERDSRITTELIEHAAADPLKTLTALRSLVEGASEAWRIFSWREDIRTILQAAAPSAEVAVKMAATELINILAARGFPEFRDLLPQVPSQ